MRRILVRPEALDSVSVELQRASAEMRMLAGRMAAALQSLDWELRERAAVEGQAQAARQSALGLADQLGALSARLAQAAREFREADAAGVGQVAAFRWEGIFTREMELAAAAAAAAAPVTAGLGYLVRQNPALFPPVVGEPAPPALIYDGQEPAPGTTNTNAGAALTPPYTNGPGERSPAAYRNVINQFAVEANPRYTPRDLNRDGIIDTFCNIYVWDVSTAMGAEIPHRVDPEGNPVASGGQPLNANGVYDWLNSHSERFGWREVGAEEAQAAANQGMPAVAAWQSGGKEAGHVAMLRPGEYSATAGPAIAQAGEMNFNETTVVAGFGRGRMAQVRYWVHE